MSDHCVLCDRMADTPPRGYSVLQPHICKECRQAFSKIRAIFDIPDDLPHYRGRQFIERADITKPLTLGEENSRLREQIARIREATEVQGFGATNRGVPDYIISLGEQIAYIRELTE